MNKFQKLAYLFKDIEILEANEKFVAASILHDKFIRVAQESDQVMDEDYLFTVIKTLADQFEDFIQDAILGRDTNNSLGLAKNFIDRVEKYVGPKYSQNIKNYANAQLDIMRKRFADMYQKYHVNDNADQSSKPSSFGKLSDSDEVAMYTTILRQIKTLLRRKNITAATKLSDQYRNWFSDEALNKNFQANVDDLFSTFVDNKNTNQPAAMSADNNKTNQSESKSTDPSNSELFNIVSNYFTNRFGQISLDEMWTKAKDPVYKNALRNKIKLKNNPALLALFERKVS
jgi:ABC-type transporter MlaC component